MHNREGLTVKMIWTSVKDWRMWPIYALGLTHLSKSHLNFRDRISLTSFYLIVPVGPPQTYLTLSLRNLGFTTLQSNLLSIPSIVLGMAGLLGITIVSEVINSRVGAAVVLQIWALPLLITLYTFNSNTSQWTYFAVVTLIAGYPYVHPIQVAWASRNSYSVRTRWVWNILHYRGNILNTWLGLYLPACTTCLYK